MPEISIILPLYQQSKQVEQLKEIYSLIREQYVFINEVIFAVNNGDEKTYQAFKKIEDDYFKVLLISDGGWGKGLKEGVKHATGNWVLYTNSARTHFDELNQFLLESDFTPKSIYKAKRKSRGILRKILSKILELEFALFSGVYQSDINGTPKLLEKALFNDLKLVENHVFIDSELTLKARNREVAFKDVPFYNYQRLEGKSTTTLKMVFFFMLQLPKKIRIWKSNV